MDPLQQLSAMRSLGLDGRGGCPQARWIVYNWKSHLEMDDVLVVDNNGILMGY